MEKHMILAISGLLMKKKRSAISDGLNNLNQDSERGKTDRYLRAFSKLRLQ